MHGYKLAASLLLSLQTHPGRPPESTQLAQENREAPAPAQRPLLMERVPAQLTSLRICGVPQAGHLSLRSSSPANINFSKQ
jgi:hypothetical protein